jgi:hypothetical protein
VTLAPRRRRCERRRERQQHRRQPTFPVPLINAILAPIHGAYKECCAGIPLSRVVGNIIARRLRK